MRNIVAAVVTLSAALVLTGCASVLCDVQPEKGPAFVKLRQSRGRTATFRYLGAGGWLIRRGDDVVMTAPFYSNPSMWKLLFARANPKVIDAELAHIADDLPRVRAVVAGHAHYDHIMDLPHILTHLPASAPVVGGVTVCNTLRSELKGHGCVSELPGGSIRIRPFPSEHAPHWHRIKLMRGNYAEKDLARLPTAWRFREGEPTAYLIDFMNGETLDLRVYYTDAGANPGKGIPTDLDIDVAILTVASFSFVKEQPKTIVKELGRPKHLLLGHWENFFWPARNSGCRVPFTDVQRYMDELKGESFTLPDRRALITVEY